MTDTPTLKPAEVAALLRVTPRQVRNLAAGGELPAFRVGKLWRFRADAVQRYIRGRA